MSAQLFMFVIEYNQGKTAAPNFFCKMAVIQF